MSAPISNLIAVASGKGGVGKTWLSITLSSVIARSGRRVLLVDGDIGLANVDVQLGLTPQRDIASALAGRHTLKEAVIRYEEGKFDILAGRSGSASLASLSAERFQEFEAGLKGLQADYDMIILDLGAGVETQVRQLAALATRCVVVVTDEPTSLTDGYAFIKLLLTDRRAPEMEVVVNQVSTQKEGDATYQALNRACMNFLNMSPRLLGVIRRDNKVKDAIRHQKSLISRAPGSTAATDAASIAVKLMQR